MCERFSFFNKAFVRFLLCISFFFLTSCGPAPVLPVMSAAPTACSSPPMSIMDRNPYLKHPISEYVTGIFDNFRFNDSRIARQDALMQMGKNTKQWSDYKNIIGDDGQMIRVSITYLDPVLVQYIILNDVLSLPVETINGMDLTTRIQSEMNRLGQQDKLFFIIIITAPVYNGTNLSIDMPVENLTLVNSDGMKALPKQYDYLLTENININQGPVFGIMGYPVSVMSGDTCVAFLNEQTSSLTLDLDRLYMGGKQFDPQFWNISYRSLITQGDSHTIPTYDQGYDSRLTKLEQPPIADIRTVAGFDERTARFYWEDMGRYLWNVLIGDSGH